MSSQLWDLRYFQWTNGSRQGTDRRANRKVDPPRSWEMGPEGKAVGGRCQVARVEFKHAEKRPQTPTMGPARGSRAIIDT